MEIRKDQEEKIKSIILSIPIQDWIKGSRDNSYFVEYKGINISLFFNEGYSDYEFGINGASERVRIFNITQYISDLINHLQKKLITEFQKEIDITLIKW